LGQASQDGEPLVSKAASEALVNHTDIGRLIEALSAPEPFIQHNAEYALFLMTGQAFSENHDKWREWWKNESQLKKSNKQEGRNGSAVPKLQ
jgi:hypothetical protein